MKKFLSGNEAFAYGVLRAKVNVISAYPITPQTTVVEKLSEFVESGSVICSVVSFVYSSSGSKYL